MSIRDSIADFIGRHRFLFLGATVALTLASAAYAPGIEFDSDPSEHFPRQVPEVKFWLDMTRRFDGMSILFVGLEEPQAPLTAEGLTRLDRITKRLAEHKADGILWARSLMNVESIREDEEGALNAEMLVSSIPTEAAGLSALKDKIVADPQVTGALISRDQMGYQILIRTDPRKDGREIARTVQRLVEEERGPMKAYYYGAPFFSNLVTNGIYSKLIYIVPLFGLLLLLPVLRGMGSLRTSLIVLLASGVPLLWWLAVMRLFGQQLSSTSANAALFLLVSGAALFGRCAARKSGARTEAAPAIPVGLGLLALACVAISGVVIPYLSKFFSAMAVGLAVTAVFYVVGFVPLLSFVKTPAGRTGTPRRAPSPPVAAACIVLVLAAGVLGAWKLRFFVAPQDIFSKGDEVGRVHGFFDRRFGGSDFIQVDVVGDMREPSNLARLMRFADMMDCSGKYADTRAITQVIAFLGNGFGGVHRIPQSREALSNLWFFIEGSNDIRPMVNEGRNEAMAALRVPSRPSMSPEEMKRSVEEAITRSLDTGPREAARRILDVAAYYGVKLNKAKLDEVVGSASTSPNAAELEVLTKTVSAKLEAWMASADSPISPTPGQLDGIRKAIGEWRNLKQSLAQVIAAEPGAMLPPPDVAAETLSMRASDIMIALRSQLLTDKLLSDGRDLPPQLKPRLRGVVSEIIAPPVSDGAGLQFHVSGFPILSAKIAGVLKTGLLVAMIALIVSFSAAMLLTGTGLLGAAAAALEALLAAVSTLAFMWAAGLQVDSSSAILALLAPMSVFFLSRHLAWGEKQVDAGETAAANSLVMGFAFSGLSILVSGVLPAVRIGVTMAAGLFIATVITAISARMFKEKG